MTWWEDRINIIILAAFSSLVLEFYKEGVDSSTLAGISLYCNTMDGKEGN